MSEELQKIARELRAYNPEADPGKGRYVHEYWAKRLEDLTFPAGYTAVDMTTAAAQGFRDGVASVEALLPKEIKTMGGNVYFADDVRAAIIAAGGSIKP